MRVKVKNHFYEGTALEVVKGFMNEGFTMFNTEYVDAYIIDAKHHLWRLTGIGLAVQGDTEEQRAESFIHGLIENKIIEKV